LIIMHLRLGVIGLSYGNGHPYSWSAIFNGYDPAAMATCPFPVIPEYLARRRFPEDAIPNATVTHIWTQDPAVSRHVAAASRIATVVSDYREMIDKVDALLLARDDAETHEEFAAPFLRAGLPVYIDKPLAHTVASADAIYGHQRRAGQIFTCSALIYARELMFTESERAGIGELRRIEGTTPKDWDRYAVHVLDPMLAAFAGQGAVVASGAGADAKARHLDLRWENGVTGRITATGEDAGPIGIRLIGDRGSISHEVADYFSAFKAALVEFIGIVRGERATQDTKAVYDVVRLIEAGRGAA
jgi:hypothetical protein